MAVGPLARLALLTALVAAATLALRVPMPATEGYINLGDALIIAGALLGASGPGSWPAGWVRPWPTCWEGIATGRPSPW